MTKEKINETILTITVGFIVLHLIFKSNAFLYIALIIGLCGILSVYLSEKISQLWFKLAELLGYVVPKVVLSIVYFCFLFPIALLARLSKKDHLMLNNNRVSYFVDRNKQTEKEDFEKTW